MSDIDYSQFRKGDRVTVTLGGDLLGEVTGVLKRDADTYTDGIHLTGDRFSYSLFIPFECITAIVKVEEPIIDGDVVWFPQQRVARTVHFPNDVMCICDNPGSGCWVGTIPDDAIWFVRNGKPQVGGAS